jgi:hypothetical protein
MNGYTHIADKLIKITGSVSPTSCVESVIIDLLKTDDINSAVDLAKKVNPGTHFASVFAREILTLETEVIMDDSFIAMKKIAGEQISEEEADTILKRYISPNGKNKAYFKSVPKEILKASSRKTMIEFFQSVLDDKAVGAIDYARICWTYLREKL